MSCFTTRKLASGVLALTAALTFSAHAADTILASVRKTGRLMVVYEGVKAFGVGAEISAMVAESDAFDYLDAPILRLGAADAPVPYNPDLERASVPQVDTIEAAARRLTRREV